MKIKVLYAAFAILMTIALGFVFIRFKPQTRKTKLEIVMDKNLIEVPPAPINIAVSGKFKLFNKDKHDIFISDAIPDCHCTSVDFPKGAIAPGDSAEITLWFDGEKMGPFQSAATIEFKGSKNVELLILRGIMK
jgi:hypothetical protein